MDEVTELNRLEKRPIVEALKKENPDATTAVVMMYADAFIDYQEAQSNIDIHGAVVMHPRTGAPIDNPYLKVRTGAAAAMRGLEIRSERLWNRFQTPG